MRFDLIYRRFQTDPLYLDEEKWAQKFFESVPSQRYIDSRAIYDLARDKYAALVASREILEKKAAGTVVFVMTVATVLSSSISHGWLLSASLGILVASMLCALAVLLPCEWPSLLSTRAALESCEFNQKKQLAQLASSIHCSIVGATLMLDSKANWMVAAYTSAIVGTAMLTMLRIYIPA